MAKLHLFVSTLISFILVYQGWLLSSLLSSSLTLYLLYSHLTTPTKLSPSKDFHVIIVGSGVAGIAMAKNLNDLGVRFTILEKEEQLGGTWYLNTYPGCACDVPSHLYSFSFLKNPNWSRAFSRQEEIRAYLEDAAFRLGVISHVRFGRAVKESRWDAATSLWTLETTAGEKFTGNVVVSGVGFLHVPKFPSIPGMDSFLGRTFHTASWPKDLSTEGLRLAVVGTGASAVQAVPALAEQGLAELKVFQRTPGWVPPRMDFAYPTWVRSMFLLIPFTNTLYRYFYFWRNELLFWIVFVNSWWVTRKLSQLGHHIIRKHIRDVVRDPDLATKLTPNYDIGCKRITPSDTYLQAFNKDHVHLVTSAIERFTDNGIQTEDGTEHEFDIIVYATGFDLEKSAKPFVQVGLKGELADDYGDAPLAYLGITHPNHPNFFILHGPGTGLGHSSVIYMLECQATYAALAIAKMVRTGARSVALKPEVLANYRDFLKENMKGKVFADNSQVAGWYRNARGVNWTLWPLDLITYWWRSRSFQEKEYFLSY